jgi:hypothetical protein
MVQRVICVIRMAGCLLFLSGCILPYTYPRLSYTPHLTVDAPCNELHAFRVDFTKHGADIDSFIPEDGKQQLSKISLASTPDVPAQMKLSADYGFAVIGVALNYRVHTNHSVAVRIYRPGFQLVEIRSWEREEKIVWKSAPELAAQEETLDRLFPVDRLDTDCKTDEHKASLLFGASEYKRLSTKSPSEADTARLTRKGDALRALADEYG